jgi:hypothetical protein
VNRSQSIGKFGSAFPVEIDTCLTLHTRTSSHDGCFGYSIPIFTLAVLDPLPELFCQPKIQRQDDLYGVADLVEDLEHGSFAVGVMMVIKR